MPAAAASLPLSGASEPIRVGRALFMGFVVAETSGAAPAHVRFWDNASAATGIILAEAVIAQGAVVDQHYGDDGLQAASGIFVEVVSGAIEGSVRIR